MDPPNRPPGVRAWQGVRLDPRRVMWILWRPGGPGGAACRAARRAAAHACVKGGMRGGWGGGGGVWRGGAARAPVLLPAAPPLLRQVPVRVDRGHAAVPGRGHGLPVPVVVDVPGREHALDAGARVP